MQRLERSEMMSVIGGKPAYCKDLSATMWVSILAGQPEIAAVIWGVMVGAGCFAPT